MTEPEEILYKNSVKVLGPVDDEDWIKTMTDDSEEGRYMRGIIDSMEEYAQRKVRARERLRIEDGMSSINEANKLRSELDLANKKASDYETIIEELDYHIKNIIAAYEQHPDMAEMAINEYKKVLVKPNH